MIQKISAVIGAHYGDEGKGRCVDWLANTSDTRPLVVRHNSGGQAGHTVETADHRHTFKHVSSGTLAGASTLLTHKFVVNPIILSQEWHTLGMKGIMRPTVWIDDRCIVSTPLDALLNQLAEYSRGARHGSCGVGFGETIYRDEVAPELTIRASGLNDARVLDGIEKYTIRQIMMRKIDVTQAPENLQRVVRSLETNDFSWEPWLQLFETMKARTRIVPHALALTLLRDYGNIIFEGAQGLLLHQDDLEHFPHVTRSRTGLQDIFEVLTEAKCETAVDVFYCSRTYITRHGNGPLKFEATEELMNNLGFNVSDPTNQPNEFQGTLRFSPIVSSFAHATADAVRAMEQYPKIRLSSKNFVISCCDQAPDAETYQNVANRALAETIAQRRGSVYLGHSPRSAETEHYARRTHVGGTVENVVEVEPTAEAESTTQVAEQATETSESTSAEA